MSKSKKNNSTKSVDKKLKESKLLRELPGEKKFKGVSKINRFNILFVDLQAIFTLLTFIMLVWYIFDSKMWHALQIILGITMIIVGYNNKIIYGRPRFAWVYYITGILLIVFDILMIVGV